MSVHQQLPRKCRLCDAVCPDDPLTISSRFLDNFLKILCGSASTSNAA